MATWKNPPLTVFHGTDNLAMNPYGTVRTGQKLSGFTVALAKCRTFTDFGKGFYTTTSLHQAKQWANARVRRILGPKLSPFAVVIAFKLDRDNLAQQDTLVFLRGTPDYWDFIDDCRNGVPPHQRTATSKAEYDVVYGPVTIWPSRLLIQDCDQISFHTLSGWNVLGTPDIEDCATAPGGLF